MGRIAQHAGDWSTHQISKHDDEGSLPSTEATIWLFGVQCTVLDMINAIVTSPGAPSRTASTLSPADAVTVSLQNNSHRDPPF